MVTNLQIDVDDERRVARSKAYVTVLQAVPDFPLQPVLTGRYHDEYTSDESGIWNWVARHMQMDNQGDTSHHTKTNLERIGPLEFGPRSRSR